MDLCVLGVVRKLQLIFNLEIVTSHMQVLGVKFADLCNKSDLMESNL